MRIAEERRAAKPRVPPTSPAEAAPEGASREFALLG